MDQRDGTDAERQLTLARLGVELAAQRLRQEGAATPATRLGHRLQLAESLDRLTELLSSARELPGRLDELEAVLAERVRLGRLVVVERTVGPGSRRRWSIRPGASACAGAARRRCPLPARASRSSGRRWPRNRTKKGRTLRLVHVLANLALRESRLEHTAQVPALLDEVLALLDRPVRFPPGANLDGLADTLHWLAWYLKRHHHRREGRAADRAAAALRRRQS
ncbi:hypothetical protein [Streptacidiphilus jiangxiensis]|uniref:Uncharacterized protein n=1 Tax=Streptacidiphilus jiangxiensis TaxID=235985 RepID=A0A1H7MQX6_STRJI|nr:hypothetical protein [Streptacidiphilus jiangxiensis]SEL13726.1 hypothetical protein SAMN05414137_10621 [Streptacidiphilus jiangxiensis]